ncbi:MAG TPA: sigma 54-interacting transcriptional regulator [Myxococcota bacterium]|nr:sigma 54-interacting transcriptional regulator [Myxococcota bacterium]
MTQQSETGTSAPAQPGRAIVLRVTTGLHAGAEHRFERATVTIGRAATNDIVLTDTYMSGEHARITLDDGLWVVRDLRSTNGSTLQRGGIRVPIDASVDWQVRLDDGDALLLGDLTEPVTLDVRIEGADEGEPEGLIAIKRIVDVPTLVDQAHGDPERMGALYNATVALGHDVEMSRVLDNLGKAVFELLPGATHLTIALADEAAQMVPVVTRVRAAAASPRAGGGAAAAAVAGVAEVAAAAAAPGASMAVSRSLLKKVQQERGAVLLANAGEELGSKSVAGAKILSTMGVPLFGGDEVLGIMQVDNRAAAGIFRERDLETLTIFASHAARALHAARLFQRVQVAEARLSGEVRFLKKKEAARRLPAIIGDSTGMRRVLELVEKVKDTRVTVAIEGETGTGKELIASLTHYQGARRDALFVAQNCAAMPESLLESELFGHKRGSFTGADQDKKGLFELAHGGTIFLDEIGEMSLGLQAKLLRALQEGEIRPVGSSAVKHVDVRVISATNRNLEEMVAKGTFRQDLFYRLRVFPIRLPPLRERREDISALVRHFIDRYASEMNRDIAGLSAEAQDCMMNYAWPGNVRELENECQRIVIQAEPGAIVRPEHLSPRVRQMENFLDRVGPRKGLLKDQLDQVERWILGEALREHGNNKSATARDLGITREGLHKKLSKFGMS